MSEVKPHVRFELSEAREKELLSKIRDASEYYNKAFRSELSALDVYEIIKEEIEANKRRVFLKRIGSVSEADALWLEQRLVKNVKVPNGFEASPVESGNVDEGEAKPKGKAGHRGAKAPARSESLSDPFSE